jgi:3-oxoacyl-[acyl-carrier protein] reductase
VVVNDVDEERAETAAKALRETHDGEAIACVGDVSSHEDVANIVETTVNTLGGLDILVNNAAIAVPQDFEDIRTDPETWDRMLDVNLTGVKNCTARAFPELKRSDNGRIINISSIAGLRISLLMGAHYTSSKWGVIGFTKHIAYEAGEYGIRANAICPGPTETPLTMEVTSEDERADTTRDIPLGRWVTPEDIGKATVFLASDLAAHVTGVALPVDGGFIINA